MEPVFSEVFTIMLFFELVVATFKSFFTFQPYSTALGRLLVNRKRRSHVWRYCGNLLASIATRTVHNQMWLFFLPKNVLATRGRDGRQTWRKDTIVFLHRNKNASRAITRLSFGLQSSRSVHLDQHDEI